MPGVTSRPAAARRGTFANGMDYLTWGDGPRTLLNILGGPGSFVPTGGLARMILRQSRPYVAAGYTVWIVTRRRHMPTGHGIADMADDYAQVIEDELGGRVDLVVGESLGGLVAQYLAARHPERLGRLVLLVAGCEVSEWGRDVDTRLATAMARKDPAGAGTAFLEYVLPAGRLRGVRRLLGPLVGRAMFADDPCPPGDVLLELEAEVSFDSRAVLPGITVPVLVVSGSRDRFFPPAVIEETVALLPGCAAVRYEGKGHLGTGTHRRLAADVLAFAGRS